MYSIWVISYNMFDFKLTLKPDAGAVVDDDKHEDDGDDMMMMVVMILMKGWVLRPNLSPASQSLWKSQQCFGSFGTPWFDHGDQGEQRKKENIRASSSPKVGEDRQDPSAFQAWHSVA